MKGGTAQRGPLFGLASAALFGLSAPLSKLLLAHVPPVLMSALLYAGSALGLAAADALRRKEGSESRVRRGDLPLLFGMSAAAGLGPVLLLFGLARVSALTASLLFNLEAPFTMLLAVLVFREHVGPRPLGAAALIIAGAVVLGWEPGRLQADALGVACIAGGTMCWAIDNNLSSKLALRDALQVAKLKSALAAPVLLVGALALQQRPEAARFALWSMLLGLLSYGVSLVLYLRALRELGAARQAAWFATAPFVGALASIPILGERPGVPHAIAAALMTSGVALLFGEKHAHEHRHEPLEHEHLHTHDEHHRHEHGPGDPPGEPHAHAHRHDELVHEHPHAPDLHHRHGH